MHPDALTYTVALLLAVGSGLLFGLVPVRQVLNADPWQVVKTGSTTATSGRWFSTRDVLLVVQIALCAVLVTSSLVAVRGLVRSLHSTFGFQPQNAFVVSTDLNMAGYHGDQVPVMQRRMLDEVANIPGVASVGLVDFLPLCLGWNENSDLSPTQPRTCDSQTRLPSRSPTTFLPPTSRRRHDVAGGKNLQLARR